MTEYLYHLLKPLLIISACIAMLMINMNADAQETKVVSDLNLWSGVEVEKSLFKNWEVSVKEEMRLKKDLSEINNVFTRVGVKYILSKNFRIEAKYRYTTNKKSTGKFEDRSRYALGMTYKGELEDLTFYYRIMHQKEVESLRLFNQEELYEKYLRHRVSLKYTDFKMIQPYISAEIFQRYTFGQFPEYDQLRFMGGLRFSPARIGMINLAYGFERELTDLLPGTYYIFRVNYTYSF